MAFGFDQTHRCSQRRESGLEGLVPLPLTLQLTRCFSAVAELLVSNSSAELIFGLDWAPTWAFRLVFGLSQKAQPRTNPKSEVNQCHICDFLSSFHVGHDVISHRSVLPPEHEASGQCQFLTYSAFVFVKAQHLKTHTEWTIPLIIFFVAVVTKQLVSFPACWNHSSISKQTLHKSSTQHITYTCCDARLTTRHTICILSR